MSKLPKIIIILGPTASGKTALSLKLAKKFNGEIINADSRQVYKEMNIGTAKEPCDAKRKGYLVRGITHHLMDIVKPDEEFTLAHFKKIAMEKINDILKRKKLPIIVGGTGLYIWAIVDNLDIPTVAPDAKLRKKLEKKSLLDLVKMLKKVDPLSAEKIDLKNPRRVIRALEVFLQSKGSFIAQQKKFPLLFNALQIGIRIPREILYRRINVRVDEQIKDGLIKEVKKLAKKYSWSLPSMSGLGYKQTGYYLRGEKTLTEAVELIKRDTRRYAKKQMAWFKRDKKIKWVKDLKSAEKLVKKFIK
ncbi:MAG: tRNA (adenosine(37)-N6)-dimethylallyltransferase MiaA [Candidatus Magasanikbacteria bacterium CG10_big_fil_rev_8_21_14_0_10_36_32]|uniref:tRNA dimethylallyltransferase n=1 Tax=Candidatus Magasanikbacteria bacterium CG10_big_fil_rev_8_21_14_0_10_36_32 TaxID=1974646 RepID=A0A2M6W6J7_9BACT|nr:MAG: tRNA (adenosine(37)-N6)-dimethylallyltransferase MiaA [Candidatus Magasanikbacteria bacterium CG10_big_fil_rev_8_21_14_0_10_36_32]